jgi:predicted nuclease with TOPRIM domain
MKHQDFDKLFENKLQFTFLMERLKTLYPEYMLNKKNNENDYNQLKDEIKNLFINLNTQKNNIILKSDLNSLEIDEYNKLIDKTKKELINDEKELNIISQEAQASKPREKEFLHNLTISKIDFFYNIFKVSLLSYFVFKILK